MKKDQKKSTVENYILAQEPHLQPMLKQIRSIITVAVPKAEEVISYMIPCYKHYGMLVGFGTHKKGCSFYTMNPRFLPTLAEELTGYQYTGSTIHFDPDKALPVALIKKIIKLRVKENEEREDPKKILKRLKKG